MLLEDVYAVSSAQARGSGAQPTIKGNLSYGASVNASAAGEATGAPAMWAVAIIGLAFLMLHFGPA
jgi:hypothetical protein